MTTLPLYMNDAFGYPVGLVLAVVIGFGFGFALERAGFGRASVLAAQFYLTDMRVLKVMFTAIVTALIGTTIASAVGVLDLSQVAVPHTYLWPQLVGGLLLGAGFIVSGYCPGTGVVAAASGKLDGLAAIAGVMLGSVLFGLAYPWVESFHLSGDLGVFRLTDLIHLSQPILALLVTAMALAMFLGGEALERWQATRDRSTPPEVSRAPRRRALVGLGVGALAGLATLLVPVRVTSDEPVPAPGRISALQLAEVLVRDPSSLFVIDVRPDGGGDPIPGAMRVPAGDTLESFVARLPGTRLLVVYDERGESDALEEAVGGFDGRVATLTGGYEAFDRTILSPPEPIESPSADDVALHRLRAALHAHFTGSSQSAPPPVVPKKAVQRSTTRAGGC